MLKPKSNKATVFYNMLCSCNLHQKGLLLQFSLQVQYRDSVTLAALTDLDISKWLYKVLHMVGEELQQP